MKLVGIIILQVTLYCGVESQVISEIKKHFVNPTQELITNGNMKLTADLDKKNDDLLKMEDLAKSISPNTINFFKEMYDRRKQQFKDYPSDDFKNNRKHQLYNYILHIRKKGVGILEYLGKYAKKDLNTTKDITEFVKKAGDDFVIQFQKYSDLVSQEKLALKSESAIDEELLFYDAIATSNGFLRITGKKLLKDIVGDDRSKVTDLYLLNRKFVNDLIRNKKQEFKYIRKNYNINRRFPSFIDYCARLIREIVELSNSKFEIAIKVIESMLKPKRTFIESIIKNNNLKLITQQFQTSAYNLPNIRNFLSALRAAIIKRYKLIRGHNNVQNKRTKAIRILFDIIDKAFERDLDGLIIIDYDNTLKGLRVWVDGRRDDIDKILGSFLDNIILRLNNVLSKNTRVEVKTLIQVILEGNTDNREVYDDLTNMGSKFVRGEEMELLL